MHNITQEMSANNCDPKYTKGIPDYYFKRI